MPKKGAPVMIRLAADSDFVLDVEEQELFEGANICLRKYTGAPTQHWLWDGTYLRPAQKKNLVLNPSRVNFRRPQGTNIQLWKKTRSVFQKWKFVDGKNS